MAKDCPECGTISPDAARVCDCGYSFVSGTPRPGSAGSVAEPTIFVAKPTRESEVTRSGQTYMYGWLVAVSGLAGATNPDLFEVNGVALGAIQAVAFLIVGFAAAVVRTWSWFVLLAFQAMVLAYGGYYMAVISREPMDKLIVAVTAVAMSGLQFVYFYKRRAMFGATWRCERLERWYPALAGPEKRDPGRVPGFAGLSHNLRLLFIMVVLVGIGLGLLAWVTPKEPTPADEEEQRRVTFRL